MIPRQFFEKTTSQYLNFITNQTTLTLVSVFQVLFAIDYLSN
jgi:hypothetical protein